MSAGNSRLPTGWTPNSSPKFFRLSHLRKLRDTEQVAAICYRVGKSGIEFLLVQTRNRRWTFPKGSTEPGLTHAQAAALEAFEEAGVHGRIEESSFTRYFKRGNAKTSIAVNAHLCEVTRLDPPQEANRNRTWFSSDKAKWSLRQDRGSTYGSQLARVVDRAVRRIEQQKSRPRVIDAMQKVTFIDNGRVLAGKTVELARKPR
jgi:8-oxo-dGTP pyrophosphatase MutT (NUDIX family)